MGKLKMRILLLKLIQKLEYPKAALTYVGVMHDDNGSVRELRQPAFKIMTYSFEGMQAIDMQQINTALREVFQCLVECAAYKGGKVRVMLLVVFGYLAINLFAILARMFITAPSIYRIALGLKIQLRHGLAERKIGAAVMGAQFNNLTRLQGID